MGQRLPRANYLLGTMTNADFATYGQAIVDGLTLAVGTFPTPSPTLVTLQGLVNDYNTALAASIGGSAEQRANMHSKRSLLEAAVREEGQYVNSVVLGNIFAGTDYPTARLQIISSGFQVSLDPSPIGPIPQAVIKKYSSPAPGQLYVLVVKLRGARTYTLEYGVTGTDPSTWTSQTFPNTRILKVGLVSGTSITFMVQGNGASGITTQSNQETQIII